MTHIPDHLQGDSPLARWWVALEGVLEEMEREAGDDPFMARMYLRLALRAIEEEGRT